MLGYIAVTLLSLPWAEQVALAKADFAAYGPAARYLDVGAFKDAEQSDLAWRFFAPHLSRDTSLSHQFTRLKRTDLIRVDIDQLGWGIKGWVQALKTYPYAGFRHDGNLLIARLDWLLAYAADASRLASGDQVQTVYYSLLGGGNVPANKKEWLKLFGIVEKKTDVEQAQVIDTSGVAFGRRLHIYHPDHRDWYETLDSKRPSGNRDPALGVGTFKADASELIVEMPKILNNATNGRVRVQAYLLTDGDGKRLDVAANDIVEDHKRFANRASVRTPGSCIACHQAGLQGSPSNVFVEFLRLPDVPTIEVKRATDQPVFDSLYLGSIGKVVRRANEDVAEFCLDHVGAEPREAVAAWVATVNEYDAPIDLAQAAHELHTTPNDVRLSLAYWSSVYGPTVQFLDAAGLAHGKSVSRLAWEDTVFNQCVAALQLWRAKK